MNRGFARKLIGDPNKQTLEQLFEGVDGVFWVDWREADEDIIQFAEQIILGGELNSEWVDDKLNSPGCLNPSLTSKSLQRTFSPQL